jgi:hypothetical protein
MVVAPKFWLLAVKESPVYPASNKPNKRVILVQAGFNP